MQMTAAMINRKGDLAIWLKSLYLSLISNTGNPRVDWSSNAKRAMHIKIDAGTFDAKTINTFVSLAPLDTDLMEMLAPKFTIDDARIYLKTYSPKDKYKFIRVVEHTTLEVTDFLLDELLKTQSFIDDTLHNLETIKEIVEHHNTEYLYEKWVELIPTTVARHTNSIDLLFKAIECYKKLILVPDKVQAITSLYVNREIFLKAMAEGRLILKPKEVTDDESKS